MIDQLLYYVILQGLFNSVMVTCFIKWGWIEYGQIYAPKWMPFNCYDFCIPFWLSVIENILLYLCFDIPELMLFSALISPALTSKIQR